MPERLVAEPIRLNYQDYCALPDDGRRYEILDGVLFMSPSPQELHQRVVINLVAILQPYVRKQGVGKVYVAPFDVLLSEHDIVEPDLIYVSESNRSIITTANVQGVPDLLVEVVSPNRPELETRVKRQVYERCGVPFYWIVDPQQQRVTELQLVKGGYAVASEPAGDATFAPRLLPDLRIDLASLWA